MVYYSTDEILNFYAKYENVYEKPFAVQYLVCMCPVQNFFNTLSISSLHFVVILPISRYTVTDLCGFLFPDIEITCEKACITMDLDSGAVKFVWKISTNVDQMMKDIIAETNTGNAVIRVTDIRKHATKVETYSAWLQNFHAFHIVLQPTNCA